MLAWVVFWSVSTELSLARGQTHALICAALLVHRLWKHVLSPSVGFEKTTENIGDGITSITIEGKRVIH